MNGMLEELLQMSIMRMPYGYKKFNFVIYTEQSAHIVWELVQVKKNGFVLLTVMLFLLNRDSDKSTFFNIPHVELWYVGLVGDSRKETPEKAVAQMRKYGCKCTGFKDGHVMSVYDDERFPKFIQTLLPSF